MFDSNMNCYPSRSLNLNLYLVIEFIEFIEFIGFVEFVGLLDLFTNSSDRYVVGSSPLRDGLDALF